MDLCNLNDIRALLNRHGFHFSKAMGQNFLIEAAVPQAIAEGSGAAEDCGVLEIGPGIGCLTAQLAQRAGKVVAVELDKRLPPVLEETLAAIRQCDRAQRRHFETGCARPGAGAFFRPAPPGVRQSAL